MTSAHSDNLLFLKHIYDEFSGLVGTYVDYIIHSSRTRFNQEIQRLRRRIDLKETIYRSLKIANMELFRLEPDGVYIHQKASAVILHLLSLSIFC